MSDLGYRALLVEALARLEALDRMMGDFGGPFHPHEIEDVVHSVQWINAVHSSPPDWEEESDPLASENGLEDVWADAEDRSRVLVGRLREELVSYHGRTPWRPYWRTTPSSGGTR